MDHSEDELMRSMAGVAANTARLAHDRGLDEAASLADELHKAAQEGDTGRLIAVVGSVLSALGAQRERARAA
jgi:hypothetical protein